jgi:hypothetical protein
MSTDSSTKGLPRAYHNIRAAKLCGMPIRTTSGCVGKKYDGISSLAYNDEFYSAPSVNYRHNYNAKQNISSSFGLSDFVCKSCGGGAPRPLQGGGEDRGQ